MKKIEVITRPEKLVGLKEIFATHNCQGMTCLSVMGCGRQKGYLPEMNFTGDDINLLPKIMVFVVVEDDQIEDHRDRTHFQGIIFLDDGADDIQAAAVAVVFVDDAEADTRQDAAGNG